LLLWIIVCAAVGGIASAVFAIAFLWIPEEQSERLLPNFLSFATGALLGAAFLALLPEAIEGAGVQAARQLGLALVAGLGLFFVIEKIVLWWHGHEAVFEGASHTHAQHGHAQGLTHGHADERRHASGVLVLVGDSLHNALDGVLISAAFLDSISLGLVTTLAVAAHEVPHRVGDFAILVHAGWSRQRALVLNLATGLASVIGAIVAYFALNGARGVLPYALAVASAGFLYIALAGLIPGLHGKSGLRTSLVQVILIGAGILVIAAAERLAGL
jgi:zinc and cadmium transporter